MINNTYIVVLNYGNYNDTIECIQSLLALAHLERKIVIVDNFSPNESVKEIENWLNNNTDDFIIREYSQIHLPNDDNSNIIFIKNNVNRGYAHGNNLGMQYSMLQKDCKSIWILNNDTTVEANSLSNLLNYYQRENRPEKQLGLIGSKIVYYYQPDTVQCIGCKYNAFLGFPKQIGLNSKLVDLDVSDLEFDYVSGAAIFISRKVIEDIGLMNDNYFLYFEELDWAMRAKIRGYSVGVCLESIVYHKEGASTKHDVKSSLASPFSDYHFTKSKLMFTGKFYPKYIWSNYLSLVLVVVNRIRRGQFKNIRSIYKALMQ